MPSNSIGLEYTWELNVDARACTQRTCLSITECNKCLSEYLKKTRDRRHNRSRGKARQTVGGKTAVKHSYPHLQADRSNILNSNKQKIMIGFPSTKLQTKLYGSDAQKSTYPFIQQISFCYLFSLQRISWNRLNNLIHGKLFVISYAPLTTLWTNYWTLCTDMPAVGRWRKCARARRRLCLLI